MKYIFILIPLLIVSSCDSFPFDREDNCNHCPWYEVPESDQPPCDIESIILNEELDINDFAEFNGVKYYIAGFSDIWRELPDGSLERISIPKPNVWVGPPQFIRTKEQLLLNGYGGLYLIDENSFELIYDRSIKFIISISKDRFLFTENGYSNIIYEYDLNSKTFNEFYTHHSDQTLPSFTKGVQTSGGLMYIAFTNNNQRHELLVLNGNNLVRSVLLDEYNDNEWYYEKLFLVNDKVILVGCKEGARKAYALDVSQNPKLLFRRKSSEVVPNARIRHFFDDVKAVTEYEGRYYFVAEKMIAACDPETKFLDIVWDKQFNPGIGRYITINDQVYMKIIFHKWLKVDWWE